jgi:hypothetical protein
LKNRRGEGGQVRGTAKSNRGNWKPRIAALVKRNLEGVCGRRTFGSDKTTGGNYQLNPNLEGKAGMGGKNPTQTEPPKMYSRRSCSSTPPYELGSSSDRDAKYVLYDRSARYSTAALRARCTHSAVPG